MRTPLIFIALSIFLWFGTAVSAEDETPAHPKPAPPNFVIILADDLGYGDIGCYGSESIPTPHLDALAAGGMRFLDFHSNGAVCSPTRAALMTGRYQQRSGIGGVVTAASHRHTGLAVEEATFADVLKENGYATAIFGKWHLGYSSEFNPIHQGFDKFRGYVSGNVDFFSHIDQAGHEDWWSQDQLVPEDGYTTHLITRHGIRFIEENRDHPFCLYLPHEAPHYPYQGPGDTAIRRKDAPGKVQGERDDIAAAYREMVMELDKGVGEILATLKRLGLEENTLVFFCSDNGATPNGSNGILRGFKGQPYEGGHRVPAIASWPGVIPTGRETSVTAMTMDLFPTLLDAAGIAAPPGSALDGVSLLPILKGAAPESDRTLFWRVNRGSAIRDGRWKLVITPARKKIPAAVELFDLKIDPEETSNLAKENPEQVEKLQKSLDTWRAGWADVPQRS